jgi:hypothetical protein
MAILLMLIVGLILGLVGGGGTTLLLPILVYALGIKSSLATSYSLVVIGFASIVGTWEYAKKQMIDYKKILFFAIPSLISIFLTRKFLFPTIPNELIINSFNLQKDFFLMSIFSVALIVASLQMLKEKNTAKEILRNREATQNHLASICSGIGVGTFSGLVGVGGGFLIMPSLLWFCRIPIRTAIGTSIFIITINCSVGFLADISNLVALDWHILLISMGLTALGMIIGTKLSPLIPSLTLKKIYGWFTLAAGISILIYEITKL